MIFRIVIGIVVLLLIAVAGLTLYVQAEADYKLERLADQGAVRALVLYHPSRDAAFSEDLSQAFAQGLMEKGFAVDRATMTGETPARPEGYALIAVVSNTFYLRPDWPTMRYLERADFKGLRAVGLMGGAGTTESATRLLEEALKTAGADVIAVRSFWISRPNDETRTNEANRDVAKDMARKFGVEAAETTLAAAKDDT
jgi:flavorubredoxin